MSFRARVALKTAVWAACLAPLALLAVRAVTDGLGANPIDAATDTLGRWTLRLLLASLAMTPLRIVLGAAWPIAFRRLLGLFAFFYLGLHFTMWIAVDHFFAWPRLWEDVVKRPYITAGVLGLLTLVPLAATSTAGMVRRLGGRAWRRLHRLAYVAAALGVLHFTWLAKVGVTDPYWYAAGLALLLSIRVWDWARSMSRRRARAAVSSASRSAPFRS